MFEQVHYCWVSRAESRPSRCLDARYPLYVMLMKPTERERKFWRVIAAALGVLLSASVFANFVSAETVPSAVTLLLFGSLVAVGVGNTIVNPRSSPVMLTEHEQASFRRRQRNVGFAFSLVLGLGIMLTELGGSALAYLFTPVVALPFVLLIRERLIRD